MISERAKNLMVVGLGLLLVLYFAANLFEWAPKFLGVRFGVPSTSKFGKLVQTFREIRGGTRVDELTIKYRDGLKRTMALPRQTENLDERGNEIYLLPVAAAEIKKFGHNEIEDIFFNSSRVLVARDMDLFCFGVGRKRVYFTENDYLDILNSLLDERAVNHEDLLVYPRKNIAGPLRLNGFGPAEGPYPQYKLPVVRWGYGPESSVEIQTSAALKVHVTFTLRNRYPGQTINVYLGKKMIKEAGLTPGEVFAPLSMTMVLEKGGNLIRISYGKWNRSRTGDARPMSVLYSSICMREDQGEKFNSYPSQDEKGKE